MGTIVSVALVMASVWVPALAFAAVAVALLGGFLATWAATVEFREWRERTQQEGEEARAAERERTRVFHARQRDVLTTVDVRTKAAQESLSKVTTALGLAESQISTLRGDNEALKFENTELKVENTELKAENVDLRTQLEAESSEAEASENAADVLALPLRSSSQDEPLWSDLEAPTVVNLDLVRLAAPLIEEVKQAHAN